MNGTFTLPMILRFIKKHHNNQIQIQVSFNINYNYILPSTVCLTVSLNSENSKDKNELNFLES